MELSCLPGRRTYAKIDLQAVAHNVQQMRNNLAPGTELTAVVKADAYGHGIVPVSRAALGAGASTLAVAMAEEAIVLREAGIAAPILVIGPSNSNQLKLGADLGLQLCVFTSRQLEELEQYAAALNCIVEVHLKIDSGMSRIGLTSRGQLIEFLDTLRGCPHIRLQGVFTHFPCADDYGSQQTTRLQHDRFMELVRLVREWGLDPRVHVSNSAASADLPELDHDAVRFGISLYGYPPSEDLPHRRLELRRVMEVYAEISHVKNVPAGTSIGYGATFTASRPMRIATVQIGYGDGYNRLLSNRGHMIVRTSSGPRKAPIVGRVCMDMTMIDVTGLEGVRAGDLALVMGTDGTERFDADDIAALCGTISYEVLLDYTSRLPRVYEERHG